MFKVKFFLVKLLIAICIQPLLWQSTLAESKTKPTKSDKHSSMAESEGLRPWESFRASQTQGDSKDKIVFIDEFDPPGDDKPKDTGAGGSRDGLRCNPDEQPIRALMPPGNFGLTTKAQPTIYLHLPQTSAKQVVIAIQNEAGKNYQRAFLPIETNNNVASFSLSKNTINLELGRNYQWKVSVICGEHLKPGDPTFSGWIQRVEPTAIQKQLSDRTIEEQIQYFGEHGYWYDLLDAISLYTKRYPLERQRSANALQDNWQQILELNK